MPVGQAAAGEPVGVADGEQGAVAGGEAPEQMRPHEAGSRAHHSSERLTSGDRHISYFAMLEHYIK